MKQNQKGITIVGLLITVIVIVTIAGVCIYTGKDLLEEAKQTELETNILLIKAAGKTLYDKKTLDKSIPLVGTKALYQDKVYYVLDKKDLAWLGVNINADQLAENVTKKQLENNQNLYIIDYETNDVIYLANADLNSITLKLLPSEYQQVEYIESKGAQYIETDYIPKTNTVVSVDFKTTKKPGEAFTSLFGTQPTAASNKRLYILFGTPNNIQTNIPRNTGKYAGLFSDGVSAIENITGAIWIDSRATYTIDIANKIISIGDEIWKMSDIFPETLADCEYPLYLLTRNTGGIADTNCSKGYLYGVTIYEDDVLVMNLIPCYKKTPDTEIGMYDTVTGTFYANKGTGTFDKGNDV